MRDDIRARRETGARSNIIESAYALATTDTLKEKAEAITAATLSRPEHRPLYEMEAVSEFMASLARGAGPVSQEEIKASKPKTRKKKAD